MFYTRGRRAACAPSPNKTNPLCCRQMFPHHKPFQPPLPPAPPAPTHSQTPGSQPPPAALQQQPATAPPVPAQQQQQQPAVVSAGASVLLPSEAHVRQEDAHVGAAAACDPRRQAGHLQAAEVGMQQQADVAQAPPDPRLQQQHCEPQPALPPDPRLQQQMSGAAGCT